MTETTEQNSQPLSATSSTPTSKKEWLEIGFAATKAQIEPIESWLLEHGALSITLFDPEDKPLFEYTPGQHPLWSHCHVKGLFDKNTVDTDSIYNEAKTHWQELTVYQQTLEEKVWELEWMESFKPALFGSRTWIIPSHHEPRTEADAINILLDPGLAFGTGTHPTTAMCLEWLDYNIQGDELVIDYGCGSGVLAIAAEKLGAKTTYGFDIDPQAIIASNDNIKANQCEGIHISIAPEKELQADIIVANILANPLCDLKDGILELLKPSGMLILSGILEEQSNMVKEAYMPYIDWQEGMTSNGWVLLVGQKSASDKDINNE